MNGLYSRMEWIGKAALMENKDISEGPAVFNGIWWHMRQVWERVALEPIWVWCKGKTIYASLDMRDVSGPVQLFTFNHTDADEEIWHRLIDVFVEHRKVSGTTRKQLIYPVRYCPSERCKGKYNDLIILSHGCDYFGIGVKGESEAEVTSTELSLYCQKCLHMEEFDEEVYLV